MSTVLRVNLIAAVLIAFAVDRVGAESIVFPHRSSGIIDVTQPPHNVDNTGQTDVTDALNAILGNTNTWTTIYLPDGTYKVSNTVSFPTCVTVGCDGRTGARGPILQGQSRKGTVIKLVDGTFTNASSPKHVLFTGEGVAQNFNRNVHNLTVNVGRNNPGASGVQFYSNNLGLMSQVDIISEDGQGVIGLDLGFGEQGPCMVSEIYIKGFARGIRSDALNMVVCARITLEGQSVYGIDNNFRYLAIDSLISINSVPAVRNAGDLTLVNARLTGGSGSNAAIQNSGQLFARGISTQGYQRALTSSRGTSVPTGASFDEFSTVPAQSQFPTPPRSMNLPVKFPPDPGWDDTLKWANALLYKGGLGQPQLSDREALQKALDDESKTIVLLPVGKAFALDDTLWVRGTTKRIVGTAGSIGGAGAIVVVDAPGAAPVVKFEKIHSSLPIIQRSNRTVVVESWGGRVIAQSGGELFVTDISTHGDLEPMLVSSSPSANIWTWQFDAECGVYTDDYYGLEMDAGRIRVFGWKSEGKRRKMRATNSVVEILGFVQYNNSWNTGMSGIPMFTVSNAQFSLGGASQVNFNYEDFSLLVRETRGSETRDFMRSQNPGGTNLPLYTGYDESMVVPVSKAKTKESRGPEVRVTPQRICIGNGQTGHGQPSVSIVNSKGATVDHLSVRTGVMSTDLLPNGLYHVVVSHDGVRQVKSLLIAR